MTLPVYSERELASEFAKLGEQLNNATDWAVRNAALRRLQSLVLGGACEFPSFLQHLKGLREPLTAQVSELRSSLVRESCAALPIASRSTARRTCGGSGSACADAQSAAAEETVVRASARWWSCTEGTDSKKLR